MGRVITGRRAETVTLSRTQIGVLADKLIPIVVLYNSREKTAKMLGFKEHIFQSVCARKATMTLAKADFERLVEALKVDASKWDLARY